LSNFFLFKNKKKIPIKEIKLTIEQEKIIKESAFIDLIDLSLYEQKYPIKSLPIANILLTMDV